MATPTDSDREKVRTLLKGGHSVCAYCPDVTLERERHPGKPCEPCEIERWSQALADEREAADGVGYDRGRRDGRDHWSEMYAARMENIRVTAYRAGQESMTESEDARKVRLAKEREGLDRAIAGAEQLVADECRTAYRDGQEHMLNEVRRHGVVKEVVDALAKTLFCSCATCVMYLGKPVDPPSREGKESLGSVLGKAARDLIQAQDENEARLLRNLKALQPPAGEAAVKKPQGDERDRAIDEADRGVEADEYDCD